jgi:hypothetical protein
MQKSKSVSTIAQPKTKTPAFFAGGDTVILHQAIIETPQLVLN